MAAIGVVWFVCANEPLDAQEPVLQLSAPTDLRIQESSTAAFAFEFRPTSWAIDTLRQGASTVLRYSFPDAIIDEQPGLLQIPYKAIVVGIPLGGRVQVEATPGRFTDFPDVELARVPQFVRDEDLGQWRGTKPAVAETGLQPADLVRADAPARYRHQEIVRLQVAPLQYDAATKTVRRYESISVRVRFVGGKPAAATAAPASTRPDPFYDAVLANAEAARSFREGPADLATRPLGAALVTSPFYKINIRSEGLYRITGQFLASKGIALNEIMPSTLQMFNNDGHELPRDLAATRPQGLEETAIWVEDGGDGRFDADDYLLFYGKGVDGFEYDPANGQLSHYLHHFATDNVYWLRWGAADGKRILLRGAAAIGGATVVTDFRERYYLEQELYSLYDSGLNWYGFLFTTDPVSRSRRYRFTLSDVVTGGTAQFRFVFLGWSNSNHHMDFRINDQALSSVDFFGQGRLRTFQAAKVGGLQSGENTLEVSYAPSTTTGKTYIDFFELTYDRALRAQNSTLTFDGRTGGGVVSYQIESGGGLWCFDVTDPETVRRLDPAVLQVSGSSMTFADSTGAIVPRRYLLASPNVAVINNLQLDAASSWRSPDHSADLVIITHEDFFSEAMRLKSLHQNLLTSDPRQTEVVKIQDVFDEFSGGLYDPTAIRDFLKYAFENWQKAPQFALLFGDGDFDPKNIVDNSDKNWIPTFQTADFDDILNRTTDHWFTYIAGNDAVMDMAIGRIPARSPQEAEDYVDKLVAYAAQPTFGAWRNTMFFVADDDLVNGAAQFIEQIHINDTEDLSDNYTPQSFDIRKLYLTEFPAVQSASISGVRKPAATEALIRQMNTGALVINYVGHGNPKLWSHERLLNIATDFDLIQNGSRQAFWVTATCDFGRFDDPKEQSFAEALMLAPGRGAISLLTSARLVFATSNATFNKQFYRALFPVLGTSTETVGLALVQARLRTGITTNDEKFHILGDPTLRLAMPRYSTQITSIEPDTIKALSVMTVRGTVQKDGAPWSDFNGNVDLEALDSRRSVQYQSASSALIRYNLPGNAVFRGSAPVANGQFTVQLFVPKDITYGGTRGRINVYFSGADADGHGARDNLAVGGTAQNFSDQAGPEIAIGFVDDADFAPGGVVGLSPVLKVTLADSLSGINITGEIGHKITLAFDGDTENKVDVTDLFQYDNGSYKQGEVRHPLSLTEGRHTVAVKAWDNFNNSSTGSVEFSILPQDRLILNEVMNYPNPFRNETSFTFVSNREAEVRVKIFTLSGRLIRTLDSIAARPGFNMVPWDGEDGDGDTLANGVYLYKVIATSRDGAQSQSAESIGKVVVQR